MDCDSRKDQLLLYALGALDGPEQQELCAHLQTGCPICEGRLTEAQAMLALLPLGLPAVKAPPLARQRLLERIAAPAASDVRPKEGAVMRTPPVTRGRMTLWPFLAGGAVAAGITVLIFSNVLSATRQTLQSVREQLAGKQDELRQVQQNLQDTTRLNQLVSSPAVKVVELKPMPPQQHTLPAQPAGAMARLFWDPQSRSIHLYAADLKMLPPGRAYELWLINDKKQAHPAGTFVVSAGGTGSIAMTMPNDPGPIMAGAVSEEAWNGGQGVLQPTMTAVQLMGNMP